MNIFYKNILLLLFALPVCLIAQNKRYSTGLVFNDSAYANTPVSAKLTRGELDHLPNKVSLRKFAPVAGDQGETGTCVAWSSAYASYTIYESILLNRTDVNITNREAFSPSFIYNQIRTEEGCMNGTQIDEAFNTMKKVGNLKLTDFPFNCSAEINDNHIAKSRNFKLNEFKALFGFNSYQKVLPVKKALSQLKPVEFGMFCCSESFYTLKSSGIWEPTSAELSSYPLGGHAMAIVGYDDDINGGSFEVLNSWGKSWGDNGYVWISYKQFNDLAKYAFEMIPPPPAVIDLQGSAFFKEISGKDMKAYFNESAGAYTMINAYPSGTNFRFYMNNNEPAYVYAFGSDLSNKSFRIFPYSDSISAYMGYKSNEVAIPDEDHYIFMDDTKGKDYFCILYSKEKLDINELLKKMEQASGDFYSRLQFAFKDKLVSSDDIEYEKTTIGFKAKSKDKSIVPLVIEITHQ